MAPTMKLSFFRRRESSQTDIHVPEGPGRQDAATGPEPHIERPDVLRRDVLLARWYVLYRLDEELARARRYNRPLSVLVGEPVLFPGQSVAPVALAVGAASAQAAARSTDLVGWLDDETYIIVMPETLEEEAQVAMHRWRSQMWSQSRDLGGQKWRIAAIADPTRFETSKQLVEAATGLLAGSLAA